MALDALQYMTNLKFHLSKRVALNEAKRLDKEYFIADIKSWCDKVPEDKRCIKWDNNAFLACEAIDKLIVYLEDS